MRTKANIELDAGLKSFATGLLPELIAALRRCRAGDLLAVVSSEADLGADIEVWCRMGCGQPENGVRHLKVRTALQKSKATGQRLLFSRAMIGKSGWLART